MDLKKIEIENEIVYLKKDWTGWRTVEPIIHPETKKFIWKNFLSKKGFLTLGYVIFLLLVLFFAFKEQLLNYKDVMENPCRYCYEQRESLLNLTKLNLGNLTLK